MLNILWFENTSEVVRITNRCKCGHSQTFLLERRRFHRKKVNLPGCYTLGKKNLKKLMVVKDLSRGGLRLKVEKEGELKIGDMLFVAFQLDDEHRSLIKKKAVIRNISGCYIGAEFCSENFGEAFDKIISYYTFH
ncbi:PilZ domain-containing protein [Desulfonema magnum]|nr:PilZ domain-containing protein [Desulfonema magnum]